MSIPPKSDKTIADADPSAVFGGTSAEVEQKKKEPSTRTYIGMNVDRGWYTHPSIPTMTWLRSGEITDKDNPLGNLTALTDDELEQEVFLCGVPLLELLHLMSGGYQVTSPWAVLVKALGTAAMDEPGAGVVTGTDARPMPLNLLMALVGVSGRGKGAAMRAPLQMALDGCKPYLDTLASGEILVRSYWEQIDVGDGNKSKKEWVRRVDQGVWANYDEIDGFAAKSASSARVGEVKPTTLNANIRTMFTGDQVGDKALSRDGDCAYLEESSYRLVVTVSSTDDRMGVFLSDTLGGTLQRMLIFPTQREEDTADPDELVTLFRARKAEMCKKLRLPSTAKMCPSLNVWGPHGEITITEEVEYEIERERAANSAGLLDAVDGHRVSIRIRLAAIFAGWVAGFGNQPVVDMNAWWWACCVTEKSRRTRLWAQERVDQHRSTVNRDLGKSDAERLQAKNDETENIIETKTRPRVRKRAIEVAEVLGNPFTLNQIKQKLSGKTQRDQLVYVAAGLLTEQVFRVVDETKGLYSYHPDEDAA